MLKQKKVNEFTFEKIDFKKYILSERNNIKIIQKIEEEYIKSDNPLKKLPFYATIKKWGITLLSTSIIGTFALSAEMLRELAMGSGFNIPVICLTIFSYLLLISMFIPVNNNRKRLINELKDSIFMQMNASEETISLFKKEKGIEAYRSLLYFNPIITNECLLEYDDNIKEIYLRKISEINEIQKIGNSF